MSTLLLGLEMLVASVLWTTLFMALAQRSKTRLRRWLTFVSAAAVPLLFYLTIVWVDLALPDHFQLPATFRATIWLLLTGQILATGLIVFFGFRDFRRGGLPTAPWPRLPLFIGLCATLLVHLITLQSVSSAVAAELIQARVETSAAAVALVPTDVPADQNAFPDYEQAMQLYQPCDATPADVKQYNFAVAAACSRSEYSQTTLTDTPPTAPDPAYVPRYLAANRECLAAILRAAQKPVCLDNLKYDQLGPDSRLDTLREMQKFSYLLLIDAQAAVREHEPARAIRNLSAHTHMIAHLLERPMLLEFIIGCALIDNHCGALQALLPSLALDPASARAIALPADLHIRESCHTSFVLEEAFGVGCFEYIQEKGGKELDQSLAFLSQPALMFYKAYLLSDDLAGYRQRVQTAQRRVQQPAPPTAAEFAAEQVNDHGLMAHLISPAILQITQLAYKNQVRADLIRLALAANVFRSQHGNWPQTPEALAGAYADLWPATAGQPATLPIDPYSGQPLHYTLETNEACIYSVGPNTTDNHGRGNTPSAPDDDDLAIRLRLSTAP